MRDFSSKRFANKSRHTRRLGTFSSDGFVDGYAPDSLIINRLHAALISIKLTNTSGQSRAYLPIVSL